MKKFTTKMVAILLSSAAALALTACESSGLKDSRDGKTYKTVKIGDKVWMAENLNFDYNHGTAKSVCYENKPENCETYGRLYTWAAAMDSAGVYSKDGAGCGDYKKCDAVGSVRGVCPEGWHLPSKEDFEELAKSAGGRLDSEKRGEWYDAGTVLKSTTGWADYKGKSGNGTDVLGFAALPAGINRGPDDLFLAEGEVAGFWSSTEYNKYGAYPLGLESRREHAYVINSDKKDGFSVRCIKD